MKDRAKIESKSRKVVEKFEEKSEKSEEKYIKKRKRSYTCIDQPEELEDDFEKYGINKYIVEKLKQKQIDSLFEVQKKVYKTLYSGKNIIVSSLTGSGKTLAFVLPSLMRYINNGEFNHKNPKILVMAPTRELSIQIAREFSDLSSDKIPFKTVLVYGGVPLESQRERLREGCDVIVGTPGRLIDVAERGFLNAGEVGTLILDEADRMLDMGFEESILEVYSIVVGKGGKGYYDRNNYDYKEDDDREKKYEIKKEESREKYNDKDSENKIRDIQVCLFSATIEDWVRKVARKIIPKGDEVFIDLVKDLSNKTPKTVTHLAVNCIRSEKTTTIADLILCYGGKNKSTLVFVNTKKECNELMISDKIKSEVQIIHGDINQAQREATLSAFREGKLRVLVATDVAARGLDIPGVDLVIQSEPPRDVDSYIHRAGRTARAGRSGTCITLYTRYNEDMLERIERRAKIRIKRIGAPQTKDIISSSIRDIYKTMLDTDESAVKMFSENAQKMVEEFGPENAVAKLLAIVSGQTSKMKSRSLLCGAEGFVTYCIKFKSQFQHAGYIWGFFKRILKEEIRAKIKGMRVFASSDGCVFDYPEEGHEIFEEILYNDRLYGSNYTIEKPDELPELMSIEGQRSKGNLVGNNTSQNKMRFLDHSKYSRRRNKIDCFVGNLPYHTDEVELKEWFENNGLKHIDFDIRLVVDKDTGGLRGFGFLSVFNEDDLKTVLKLNGKDFCHRKLVINQSKSK